MLYTAGFTSVTNSGFLCVNSVNVHVAYTGCVNACMNVIHDTTQKCQPGRKRAYNADLRWRIVYQRIGRNPTFANIATNLCISTATAQRIYSLFESTGNVESVPTESTSCKISGRDELYTMQAVEKITRKW